jgi:hypothetical protein
LRLLLLLIIAGVGAYFTVPTQAAHEEAARAFLEGREPGEAPPSGVTLDSIIGYVKGMLAGQGRYENYYLASKYTLDVPGSAYVECYGAFTLVRCAEVAPASASAPAG